MREVVHAVRGNPSAGALAGAVIGVRLESGQWARFGYANYAPFQPGERVEIIDGRLRPMPY